MPRCPPAAACRAAATRDITAGRCVGDLVGGNGAASPKLAGGTLLLRHGAGAGRVLAVRGIEAARAPAPPRAATAAAGGGTLVLRPPPRASPPPLMYLLCTPAYLPPARRLPPPAAAAGCAGEVRREMGGVASRSAAKSYRAAADGGRGTGATGARGAGGSGMAGRGEPRRPPAAASRPRPSAAGRRPMPFINTTAAGSGARGTPALAAASDAAALRRVPAATVAVDGGSHPNGVENAPRPGSSGAWWWVGAPTPPPRPVATIGPPAPADTTHVVVVVPPRPPPMAPPPTATPSRSYASPSADASTGSALVTTAPRGGMGRGCSSTAAAAASSPAPSASPHRMSPAVTEREKEGDGRPGAPSTPCGDAGTVVTISNLGSARPAGCGGTPPSDRKIVSRKPSPGATPGGAGAGRKRGCAPKLNTGLLPAAAIVPSQLRACVVDGS